MVTATVTTGNPQKRSPNGGAPVISPSANGSVGKLTPAQKAKLIDEAFVQNEGGDKATAALVTKKVFMDSTDFHMKHQEMSKLARLHAAIFGMKQIH